MDTDLIVAAIDGEIGKLRQARALLGGFSAATPAKKLVASVKPMKRKMSPAARKRIAAAQKKRWAAARTLKEARKPVAKTAAEKPAKGASAKKSARIASANKPRATKAKKVAAVKAVAPKNVVTAGATEAVPF